MCGLCGILGGVETWSDAARAGLGTRRAERLNRVRTANRILRHYGLRLNDWQGTSYVLSSATGKSAIVPDLGALWPEAARLSGRTIDPLAPVLLDSLERD